MERINVFEKGMPAIKAINSMAVYLSKSAIDPNLLHLLYFRVSQLNGCAFCLDMHSKDLRANGETEQRLYMLDAWREAPVYTKRERAALAWAESLTKLSGGAVPDDVYAQAATEFSETELIDLMMAVIAINTYNRVNIAFPNPLTGTYQPGQYKAA